MRYRGASANKVDQHLHDARSTYLSLPIYVEMAFLKSSPEHNELPVMYGPDAHHIHSGRVVARTLHYTMQSV